MRGTDGLSLVAPITIGEISPFHQLPRIVSEIAVLDN